MKKTIVYSLCLLALLSCPSAMLHAQTLDDVMKAVKDAAQTHNKGKGSSTGNKSDSATTDDSAAINRVFGAFGRAAAANPNDTSSADLTMKALSMMVGGQPVSHDDSVNAINRYRNALGGTGVHYTYSTTSIANSKTFKDTSHIYFTTSGEGRFEMRIPMPGVRMNRMISIGRYNMRRYTIMLYPESKTFALNVIDTALLRTGGDTYQATKIGNETVQGYACIHVKLNSTNHSRFGNYHSTIDVWTSRTVPGYSTFKQMVSAHTGQTGMMRALETAGCDGFIVKMTITGKDYSMNQVLIKSSEGILSADLFLIPSEFSESKQSAMAHMIPSSQ